MATKNTADGKGKFQGDEVELLFNSSNHFDSEKSMGDYIATNISVFCEDIIEDSYRGYRREHNLFGLKSSETGSTKPSGTGRVDFFIRGSSNSYLVEIKNPIHIFSELTKSIGQMMVYGELLLESGVQAQMILVTSKHERMVPILINKYHLPIRYIVFNKEMSVEAKIYA